MGHRHPPDSYIEDPSPYPNETSKAAMPVSDLFDEYQAEEEAVKREKDRAHLILNNKRFIEDIHPSKRTVKLDQNTRHFLKQKLSFPGDVVTHSKQQQKKKIKFMCKYIDSEQERKQKKMIAGNKKKYPRKKKHINPIQNIVIEDYANDGKVRAATMEEIYNSSYKPKRYTLEFLYTGAKNGWLDKTMHGKDSWGKATLSEVVPPAPTIQKKI